MTIRELIEALREIDRDDAEVRMTWEGVYTTLTKDKMEIVEQGGVTYLEIDCEDYD